MRASLGRKIKSDLGILNMNLPEYLCIGVICIQVLVLKRKVFRLEMQIWRHRHVIGALGEIIIGAHVKEPKTEHWKAQLL